MPGLRDMKSPTSSLDVRWRRTVLLVSIYSECLGYTTAYPSWELISRMTRSLTESSSRFNMPTENALTKARKYVQAKSERIMFIKGMLSLLDEQPQPKRLNNF